MIINVNEKFIDETEVEGENLEEVISWLQERHLPADHIIGDVLLNGESYHEDLPHAAIEIPRDKIKTLTLVTRSPEEIAIHFLEHGSQLIDSMHQALPKITEMFRLGDETEANEHYLRFLESLHLLVSMFEQVCQIMCLPIDLPIGHRDSFNAHMGRLAESLTQLLSTQEQTDWVFLADILEYELAPQLVALSELLPHMKKTGH